MKRLRRLISADNFWPIVLVITLAVLAGRTLIFQSGYFNMHDDLQMMRQLQMEKCFADGQIPCRWVPDMGYGFGFPLFNFYPPLPYLIGQGIRVIGFSFVNTVKLNFALTLIVSGVAMYLLAKEFFGKLGAVVAAAFYIWAPYHAVDIYVRGAMNEAYALALFPLIFWIGYKLVISDGRKAIKWIILLALSYFALLTSHNLMALIFTPLFGVWVLIHLWLKKRWRLIPQFLLSAVLSFGLTAFFTLPALAENKFTQIRGQLEGYYDYSAHFVSLRQLFITRFWGYGPSVWVEAEDRMSFQVGHLHWLLSLVILSWLVFSFYKKRKNIKKELKNMFLLTTTFALLTGWFSTYMTHLRSIAIYKAFPTLRLIQFPWRFLAIVIFVFSFISGAVVIILKNKEKLALLVSSVLVTSVLVLNWNYFLPEHGKMGALTDEEKFSGAAWDLQQTAGIYDYLPVTAEMAPREPQKQIAEIIEGEGEITDGKQGTNWAEFSADIDSEVAIVRLGIFQFPDWRVFVDNDEVENYVDDDEKWGRMYIEIPEGEHMVRTKLFNTPIRTASNLISLFFWLGLLGYLVARRQKWPKR